MRAPNTPQLDDPVLLHPRHSHVADGAHLSLQWEPVPNARRYKVEVASDELFDEILFEQDLPSWATTLVVWRPLPEDGRTLYWRARAGDDEGWSVGGHVESFISGRAEDVGQFVYPDEAEPLGPIAALFKTTSLEALAEALPGDQPRINRTLGEDHPEGVEGAEVFTVYVGLTIAVAIVLAIVMIGLFWSC